MQLSDFQENQTPKYRVKCSKKEFAHFKSDISVDVQSRRTIRCYDQKVRRASWFANTNNNNLTIVSKTKKKI